MEKIDRVTKGKPQEQPRTGTSVYRREVLVKTCKSTKVLFSIVCLTCLTKNSSSSAASRLGAQDVVRAKLEPGLAWRPNPAVPPGPPC